MLPYGAPHWHAVEDLGRQAALPFRSLDSIAAFEDRALLEREHLIVPNGLGFTLEPRPFNPNGAAPEEWSALAPELVVDVLAVPGEDGGLQLVPEGFDLPLVPQMPVYEEAPKTTKRKKRHLSEHVLRKLQAQMRMAAQGGQGLRKLFLKYDTDRSGTLNVEELRRFIRSQLRLSQEKFSDADVNILLTTLDEDGTGTLSIDKLIAFVERAGGEDGDDASKDPSGRKKRLGRRGSQARASEEAEGDGEAGQEGAWDEQEQEQDAEEESGDDGDRGTPRRGFFSKSGGIMFMPLGLIQTADGGGGGGQPGQEEEEEPAADHSAAWQQYSPSAWRRRPGFGAAAPGGGGQRQQRAAAAGAAATPRRRLGGRPSPEAAARRAQSAQRGGPETPARRGGPGAEGPGGAGPAGGAANSRGNATARAYRGGSGRPGGALGAAVTCYSSVPPIQDGQPKGMSMARIGPPPPDRSPPPSRGGGGGPRGGFGGSGGLLPPIGGGP